MSILATRCFSSAMQPSQMYMYSAPMKSPTPFEGRIFSPLCIGKRSQWVNTVVFRLAFQAILASKLRLENTTRAFSSCSRCTTLARRVFHDSARPHSLRCAAHHLWNKVESWPPFFLDFQLHLLEMLQRDINTWANTKLPSRGNNCSVFSEVRPTSLSLHLSIALYNASILFWNL